ncbi:DNA cytosine methyltransferase, partial [Azospirillum sp. B506]|uniref:DNA cytosine methyltransferase n=1 Tax=Azospirillum sp. B506 TaxID=137721 RepID=UPI0011DCC9AF
MAVYYNEFDPFAAQWLRNLIDAGLIPAGDVDERSILDVRSADLAGYTQCHFFVGIGGWPLALRLAGWPDDRPVWTGSCPCQPLSSAGKRKGHADERHLWPAFFGLIAECRPATVSGEQVASKDGREWFAAVRADLETLGYAVGGGRSVLSGRRRGMERNRSGGMAGVGHSALSISRPRRLDARFCRLGWRSAYLWPSKHPPAPVLGGQRRSGPTRGYRGSLPPGKERRGFRSQRRCRAGRHPWPVPRRRRATTRPGTRTAAGRRWSWRAGEPLGHRMRRTGISAGIALGLSPCRNRRSSVAGAHRRLGTGRGAACRPGRRTRGHRWTKWRRSRAGRRHQRETG